MPFYYKKKNLVLTRKITKKEKILPKLTEFSEIRTASFRLKAERIRT